MSIVKGLNVHKIRRRLKRIPAIQVFSSIKIAVTCLLLLFVLTFWGTVAQVNSGLYSAQERYFYSWFFLVLGFFPFPGARLVLWTLFINLLCVLITRFVYKLSHIGILIIHIGLLTYFVSAFVTFHVVEESNLTLLEGEGSNVSSAYYDWELSVWKSSQSDRRNITALDVNDFKVGQTISFKHLGFQVFVQNFVQMSAYLKTAARDCVHRYPAA